MDAPRAHAAGHEPDRVLLLGSGPAVGWGVSTHALSLCGALARAVASRTGRGCDVDLEADPGLAAGDVERLLGRFDLDAYAAVVLVVGVNDAITGTPLRRWDDTIGRISALALSTSGTTTEIVFVGIPALRSIPVLGARITGSIERYVCAMNSATRRRCTTDPRLTFVALPGQSDGARSRYRSPTQYQSWAAAIVDPLAPLLDARHDRPADSGGKLPPVAFPFDEVTRQSAVDELALDELAENSTLKTIVTLARQAFGVETAIVTIIDRSLQRHLVRVGIDAVEIPREDSFCAVALHEREPLIVRNALDDSRFNQNPLVTGDFHLRFYAGIPLIARTGERVGALCVIGREPRDGEDDDISLDCLRELAVLAEEELWAKQVERHAAAV